MGIQTVLLYTNTTSEVPATFTDVTSQFSGLDPNTVADETASATITLSDIPPGTTVFAWIEAIDEAGNSSGIQPVGSATTKYLFAVPNQSITDSRGVTFDVYNVVESPPPLSPYVVGNDPTAGLTAFTLMFPILANGNYTSYPLQDRFNFNLFGGNPLVQIRYYAKSIIIFGVSYPEQTVPDLWSCMNNYHVFTWTSNGAGTYTIHLHLADGSNVVAALSNASLTGPTLTTSRLAHGHEISAGRNYYVGGPRVFSRALTSAEIQTQAVDMLTP